MLSESANKSYPPSKKDITLPWQCIFDISIIPHTYNKTNFSNLKVGNSVNIEFDSLARYIHSKDD